MAVEKFIRGKRDDCHHDGKAANTRRLQAAIFEQQVGLEMYYEAQEVKEERVTMTPGVEYLIKYDRPKQ